MIKNNKSKLTKDVKPKDKTAGKSKDKKKKEEEKDKTEEESQYKSPVRKPRWIY